jgi:hypothetical protein
MMHDSLETFLSHHENDEGEVGDFIRSCILVSDLGEILTRTEMLKSDQLGYLLDCFPTPYEDE